LVVWNIFYFSIILGISSSQLTNSIIFQRGRYTTIYNHYYWYNYNHYYYIIPLLVETTNWWIMIIKSSGWEAPPPPFRVSALNLRGFWTIHILASGRKKTGRQALLLFHRGRLGAWGFLILRLAI
jgi:hypothetical protein